MADDGTEGLIESDILGILDGDIEMGGFTIGIEVDIVDGEPVIGLADTGFTEGIAEGQLLIEKPLGYVHVYCMLWH